jgi:hypothetical protein
MGIIPNQKQADVQPRQVHAAAFWVLVMLPDFQYVVQGGADPGSQYVPG